MIINHKLYVIINQYEKCTSLCGLHAESGTLLERAVL